MSPVREMKYLVSGDWHLTGKTPRIRTDNYPETQLKKVDWICNLANEKDAALIIAGDIGDKPMYPISLLNQLIVKFRNVENGVYVVFGQHDIFYHNPDITKTPLGTLFASESVYPIDGLDGITSWMGFNFGEEIRCPENDEKFMVAHFPVTPKEPPFYMKDALSAKDFIERYPGWKVIVTGDYHVHHITKHNGTLLVNPGPICRSSKDKMNFKPSVTLIDTDKLTTQVFDIPIEEKVFNLDLADKDDLVNYRDDIRELAESIKTNTFGKKFKDVLDAVIVEMNPRESVKIQISKVMEKVYERTRTA